MHKDIEDLLSEYKYLPTMIKNTELEISFMDTTKDYSREEELTELRNMYKAKTLEIESALSRLNARERKSIELRYFQINKLTAKEIADKMGYSRNTYFKIRRRALEKLAEKMASPQQENFAL